VMNYDPDNAGQNAMRRSIDLLLARGLRVRILKLADGLDPDDFVRREGGEIYSRLLANAPHFWQYLMTEAARRHDLDQPAMKATAVNDVMEHVAKIQDRVEQLEVARAVAENFKIPEAVIFERLKLSPGPVAGGRYNRPAVPGALSLKIPAPGRKLTLAEKQLIQALMQDPEIARAVHPLLEGDFLSGIWSGPVLKRLAEDPARNIEMVLEGVQDEELKKEVRAAVLEPFGRISGEQALASVKRLYDAHLVQKIEEIRAELKQYGSGAAPAELVRRHMEIVAEKNRIGAFKA